MEYEPEGFLPGRKGLNLEKHLDTKITLTVTEQLGSNVFPHQPSSTHQYDHCIGEEMDHQSSLLRQIVKGYLNLRLKTYGKKYTHEVALGNKPSLRHELTKSVLFQGV